MQDYLWRKAKREWERADDIANLKIEQDILVFAAIHIDLDLNDGGVSRVQDVMVAQKIADEPIRGSSTAIF